MNELNVVDRFIRYVQIDTQSDPESNSFPSTSKQKNLSSLLAKELNEMGIQDVETDEFGYVYATIPATTQKQVPVICFCSHIDTAPDCSGTGVKPIIHKNYDGKPIVLPNDTSQILTTEQYPYLKHHIGNTIITASGDTLLGADDKAGVAIIMEFAHYLIQHPEIEHGTIKILFTPDEEVGRGTEKVDLKKLGAQYAYTLDGGEIGTLEDETFSADAMTIKIFGTIVHPGMAKNKLVNALKIAGEILAALPKTEWCPEATEGREGFVHPVAVNGIAEACSIDFIIRDFETANLQKFEHRLMQIADQVVQKHKDARVEYVVKEQYRNMKEVLDQHPQVVAFAEEAYKACGLKVIKEPIRGGTDGSKLSFMGLPTANLFTGMQGIHSKLEWIGENDMIAAIQVLVELSKIWAAKA